MKFINILAIALGTMAASSDAIKIRDLDYDKELVRTFVDATFKLVDGNDMGDRDRADN